jgi:hypothetical protein
MRTFFLGAFLLVGLVSQATAQQTVGPIAIKTNVNGVPITVSATSWISVNSVDNELIVSTRIFADLIDLQRKFSNVVDTFKLPADTCANRGVDNQSPVVSLKSGSLWPRGDQLILSTHGHFDIWSCVTGPPRSGIKWQKKKIAFIKMKVPVFHTWTKVKKKKDGTQPFYASLPIQLVKTDNATVAISMAEPNVKLEEQEVFVTNANLKIAKVNISQKAYNALQSAIDLAKLKENLPEELQKLNMTVVSARFRNVGGHAIAEINLAARVSGDIADAILYLR